MKLKNMYIVLYSLLQVYGLAATPVEPEVCKLPNTYHGVRITPHTVYDLMPGMPSKLKQQVRSWLDSDGGYELIDQLVDFNDPANWSQAWEGKNKLLEGQGYKNISSTSFVAHIPDADYLFKVAAPKYRVLSMLATKGVYDKSLLEDDTHLHNQILKRLGHESLPTYQTASRAAYYLLVNELLEKQPYDYVSVPETYLFYIGGEHEKNVYDQNVMLIQRYIPGQMQLSTSQVRAVIPKRAVEELYDIVVQAGLWNVKNDILVEKNGQLILTNGLNLIGFEGYPNTSSKDFFHKNEQRFHRNQVLGVKSLMDLFADQPDKVAYIKHLIKGDGRLCHCGKKHGFLGMFAELFNRGCDCQCEAVQELLDYEPQKGKESA